MRPDAAAANHRASLMPGLLLALVPFLLSVPRAAVSVATALLALVSVAMVRGSRHRLVPLATDHESVPSAAADADGGWALDAATDAIVVTDLASTIVQANAAARALFGEEIRRGGSFDGARAARALADASEFARALAALYAHPTEHGAGEVSAVREGVVRIYEWSSEPVRDGRGIVGRGFAFRDRTQQQELAALKREFLSTVTHELRTPLTSVKGSLQLVLGKSSALSAIERELLTISLKNTDRLIRLINDMLDISQLELGKMDLSFAPVAPAALVDEAIAGLRAYAAGRDIAIACEIEPDLPAVAGDHDRLMQVLTNLLSNAVKFSPTGGRVLVHVSAGGGELRIAVRDWGVGIRASDHGRLFQRFQRLNPAGSDEPGTGLGLAISKAIVDRHDGRIAVESEEAAGSTFTVVLPLAERLGVIGGVDDAATALVAPRPTLLLIDDDADFGTVLEVSLGNEYRLLRCERGVQALDVARAERPHLVLLDVVLPDLSGYDVLRILQHSEATRGIPVVMLTVQPERMLARGLGAVDVLAKPVDVEDLRRVIGRALRPASSATALRVAVGPLPSRAAAPIVAALEAGGHAVFTADDAWELVRCADECQADVAIIEPEQRDGAGTLAFLRGHATTRRLPLVLLTGNATEPAASGCTCVDPGVGDAELVRVVEKAAGRSRVAPSAAGA